MARARIEGTLTLHRRPPDTEKGSPARLPSIPDETADLLELDNTQRAALQQFGAALWVSRNQWSVAQARERNALKTYAKNFNSPTSREDRGS